MRLFALSSIFLLLAGTVEAGKITCVKVEHNIPWYAQAECTDVPRSEPLRIDANGQLSVVDECPQRMREAMQAMDEKFTRRSVKDERFLYTVITHEERQQWDAVMKDCVH